MSEEGVERRLTTILAADVVGYSRLMSADEAGTLTSLKAIRRELIEPKTAEHHGRVVKPFERIESSNQGKRRMQISVKTANEVKVLAFEGSLDTQTSSDALTQLTQLIEGGDRKILVNFEKLHYISSVGLRILLAAAKQLKTADGELRICDLNEVVKEVFDISGFSTIFKIFENETEALDSF